MDLSCERCGEPGSVEDLPMPAADGSIVCRRCLSTEDVIALLVDMGLDSQPSVRDAIGRWRAEARRMDEVIN